MDWGLTLASCASESDWFGWCDTTLGNCLAKKARKSSSGSCENWDEVGVLSHIDEYSAAIRMRG